MANLSTLVDEFSSGSAPDSGRWPVQYGSPAPDISGGRARMSCSTTYAGMASARTYTLDYFDVEPFPPALNSAVADCYQTCMVQSDAEADGTTLGFYIDRITGLIYAVNWSGFFDASAVSETYNATDHAWLHLTYNGSSVVWSRSATFQGSRTTIRTLNSPPSWAANTDIFFYSDTHRDAGTSNFAELGAINPPEVHTATGSAVFLLGGASTQSKTVDKTSSAVLSLSGTSTQSKTVDKTGPAVLLVAGTSVQSKTVNKTGTTALELSGTSVQSKAVDKTSSAVLSLDSRADSSKTVDRTGATTLELSASGTASKTSDKTGSAGLLLSTSGEGSQEGGEEHTATGTAVLSLSASASASTTRTGTGTLALILSVIDSSGQEELADLGDDMARIAYVSREKVQRALSLADVTRLNMRVDSAVRAGAREIEGFLHRRFYPTKGVKYFDIPDTASLWLHDSELAAAPTSVVSGGTTLATTDYILQPMSGPPYRWIDINYGGSQSWVAGDTYQRAIAITADSFGANAEEDPAGALTASMGTTTAVCDVTDSSLVGVCDLIRIGSERMVVKEKTYTDTGVTLSAGIAASKAVVELAVSSGAGISAGENIQIGSERMYVESILGDTLTVLRGQQGSVLAAHSSSDQVWAPRRLSVARAQAGTTAAAHDNEAEIFRNAPPSLVEEGNLALAILYVQQAMAGYVRSRGSQDSSRTNQGRGVQDVLEGLYTAYGRKSRSRAVM